jgi:iron-sulfur cluster assembly protein
LGLALDEPKDNDTTYNQDGVQYLVDKDLFQQCGAVKIDFVDAGARSGFSITPTNPLGGGGSCSSGSCSTAGSCGC